MELKKIIKQIQNNPSYNLKDCFLDYVKKDNNGLYLIVFDTDVETTGKQFIYTYNEKTNESDVVFLPSIESFNLLDYFEKLPKVKITLQ